MPTSSEAAICNIALRRVGIGKTIGSLTEASPNAQACADFYAVTRDRLLESYAWPFAIKRVQLSPYTAGAVWLATTAYKAGDLVSYGANVYRALQDQTGQQPDISGSSWFQVTRDGWGFCCPLPPDCVTPQQIFEKPTVNANSSQTSYSSQGFVRTPTPAQRQAYSIEDANDGTDARVLLTDLDTPILQYVSQDTNPTSFPASFVSALAYLLASELAPALRSDLGLGERLYKAYLVALSEAISSQRRGVQEDPEPMSEFEASRQQ